MVAEKRLENVNIRMRESLLVKVDGLANSKGMNRSEWVCDVIEAAVEKEHQQYLALHSIFGHGEPHGNENSALQRNTSEGESENSD